MRRAVEDNGTMAPRRRSHGNGRICPPHSSSQKFTSTFVARCAALLPGLSSTAFVAPNAPGSALRRGGFSPKFGRNKAFSTVGAFNGDLNYVAVFYGIVNNASSG